MVCMSIYMRCNCAQDMHLNLEKISTLKKLCVLHLNLFNIKQAMYTGKIYIPQEY